jgi:hypothetical protein
MNFPSDSLMLVIKNLVLLQYFITGVTVEMCLEGTVAVQSRMWTEVVFTLYEFYDFIQLQRSILHGKSEEQVFNCSNASFRNGHFWKLATVG